MRTYTMSFTAKDLTQQQLVVKQHTVEMEAETFIEARHLLSAWCEHQALKCLVVYSCKSEPSTTNMEIAA